MRKTESLGPGATSYINWSGGKDAALSLYRVLTEGRYQVSHLLTTVSAEYRRISMHGVREALLQEQATQIGIPLKVLYMPEHADITVYNHMMKKELQSYEKQEIRFAIFGDIFLEDLRKYREEQLAQVNLQGVFPLWKTDTRELIRAFLDAGFKAIVTCVNARLLDRSFAGREVDLDFIGDLPPGVDPCGENGEFHTFVYDGPFFDHPVCFTAGEVVERVYKSTSSEEDPWDNRYYFCDLLPCVGIS